MSGALTLVTTGLASNAQGFTNCVYVHPTDLSRLADAAGAAIETVTDKGLMCAVGEAVFVVKCVGSGQRAGGGRMGTTL